MSVPSEVGELRSYIIAFAIIFYHADRLFHISNGFQAIRRRVTRQNDGAYSSQPSGEFIYRE